MPKYKRILIKMSGEALLGEKTHGIDPNIIDSIAQQLNEVKQLNVDIAIVIGGGNIFRGVQASADGMDRSNADYIGMLATVMNSLALQDGFEKTGLKITVQSAIPVTNIVEPFIQKRALRLMEKGHIIIFSGGTGHPYFSTDTAGVLRAMEMKADIIFKATKVDGVYDKDPVQYSNAVKYETLTYQDFLNENLKAMDATAVALCQENKLPLLVFNLLKKGNIKKAVLGEKVGTLINAY